MNPKAGDTFLFPLQSTPETPHLWVVATEPGSEGRFVAVNFTSLRGAKDQTVVIRAGEHPFVTHDTCVLYSAAELTDCDRVCGVRLHENRIREFVREYRAGRRARRAW